MAQMGASKGMSGHKHVQARVQVGSSKGSSKGAIKGASGHKKGLNWVQAMCEYA